LENLYKATAVALEPGKYHPGYNPRFPNQNQTKHCWSAFVEFHKCAFEKGDPEDPKCKKFQVIAKARCPTKWVRTIAFSSTYNSLVQPMGRAS
jgi:cytochrome c oxidase subunit 6b